MKSSLLLSFLFFGSVSFAQMEVGSVWKLTGNAATFFESNNIDSTKIHFLASDVFLITYENNGTPYTETSTWSDLAADEFSITYDPTGIAFGSNCPTASTIVQYNISSNVLTMVNVTGNCSLASAALINSNWNKVGGTANVIENTQDGISVFPNPANESIILNSTLAIDLKEVKIYNLLGQEQNFLSTLIQANQLEINVADFPKGWYFIELNSTYKQRFEIK